MDIGLKIGDKFRADFPKWPGQYIECKLVSTTIENDSFGTIKIEHISDCRDEHNIKHFKAGERTSIVEEMWFNVPEYRIITKIN